MDFLFMGKPGIYKITNPKGLIYIGSSKDPEKRIYGGYKKKVGSKLRLINKSIYDFGFKAHVFEIIERCDLSQLNNRERYWQEHFNCLYPNGLNKNFVSCDGKKQLSSLDTKRLISESKKGVEAYNKGVPRPINVVKKINSLYSPLTRKSSTIIFDPEMGIYYYCYREAAITFKIPKQTLKMNLTAPNCDCRKNKTRLIIV